MSAEVPASAGEDDIGIDWSSFFDEHDLHGSAFSQVATWVELQEGNRTEEQAKDLVNDAKERGDIVTEQGKHYPAGELPDAEAESDDTEGEFTSKKQGSPSDSTVEVSESRLAELEERVAKAEAQARRADRRAEKAIQAVGQLVGLGENGGIVVDEVVEQAHTTGNRIDRMSATISKVSQQLDDVADLKKDDGQKLTKEGRVTMLRQYVAKKAQEQQADFAVDYNAVQAFFEGADADIGGSYASQLIDAAAEGHHAFYKKESGANSNKRLAVKADKIEDGSIYSVKNSGEEEGV